MRCVQGSEKMPTIYAVHIKVPSHHRKLSLLLALDQFGRKFIAVTQCMNDVYKNAQYMYSSYLSSFESQKSVGLVAIQFHKILHCMYITYKWFGKMLNMCTVHTMDTTDQHWTFQKCTDTLVCWMIQTYMSLSCNTYLCYRLYVTVLTCEYRLNMSFESHIRDLAVSVLVSGLSQCVFCHFSVVYWLLQFYGLAVSCVGCVSWGVLWSDGRRHMVGDCQVLFLNFLCCLLDRLWCLSHCYTLVTCMVTTLFFCSSSTLTAAVFSPLLSVKPKWTRSSDAAISK